MAKGHSGNAFSTDFSSMFNGLSNAPAKKEPKAVKEEVKPAKAPSPAKKTENVEKKEEKKTETKPATKKETKPVVKKEETAVTPKNPKSILAAQNGEVYITIAFLSLEDRDYLKFKSKELGITTSEFFWTLVEDDIKSTQLKKFDSNDEKHQEVKTAATAYTTSIKLKNEQKAVLPRYAVKHRLPIKKYTAYIVNKARLSDADWF